MAQSGFTPIQIYYSTTAGNVPLAGSLANGELAINTNDGVLYYKDSGGVVQVLASGSSISVSAVAVATTTNLASLSGLLTVDGVTLTANQRVLVKDQTLSQNNGVYVAAVGAWTRAIDANSSTEIASRIISVVSGSTNGGEQFATTFKSTDTLGTTAMSWFQVALQNTSVTFTDLTTTGNMIFGNADTDTITQSASYVTGTQLKSAKVATNTLSLAAYDVDGAAYTNLITLTASNTPTLTLTSTGVGTINNMSIGATTASTGAFTTLSSTGNTTIGDVSADTLTVNATSTFLAKPTVQLTTATTNAVTQVFRLDSQSSGTPANGIGVGMEFAVETTAGNTEVGATIDAVVTDVTATSEDFDLVVKLMTAGATAAETARFKSTGLSLVTGDTYQINNVDVLSATALGTSVVGSSLTSVGTIATGTWQGTLIGATYGGTGVNNGTRTLTINTNAGTIAFSGASTTMTFPSTSQTLAGLALAQTWTAAQTFRAASSVRAEAAATQDAIVLAGRAGGTGSFAVSLTPTTLSANRTVTLPDGNVTIPSGTVAVLGTAQTFTAAQTFQAANAVRSEAAATQDAVVLAGRAGGTGSFAVTLTPTTLSASRTLTLPNVTDTLAVLGTAQTFTAAQTFRTASAIRSEAAATQDAVVLAGRAGGTGSFAVTLTPTTLTANRTLTLPDGDVTLPTGTYAVLGTAQTFTAAQTFRAASAVRSEAAATQDAIVLAGRAGGTGSFAATITTDTLAASVTHTLPAITGTLATLANTGQTFTGQTAIIPTTNSATITIGAIPQTGTITVDRSQATHTLDVGVGPTLSGNTKTINFGTAGVSGSTTNINIGSAVSGSTTTTAVNGNVSANYQADSNYFIDINNPFSGTYTTAKFVGIRAKGFFDNLGTATPYTNYSGYLGWSDEGNGNESAKFQIYTNDVFGNQTNVFNASAGSYSINAGTYLEPTTQSFHSMFGSVALGYYANVFPYGTTSPITANNSVAIGRFSGAADVPSGATVAGTMDYNTSVGDSAFLISVVSPRVALVNGSNVSIGSQAVSLSATGGDVSFGGSNVAVGASAGKLNAISANAGIGNGNIFVGAGAGQIDNIVIQDGNIAIGLNALNNPVAALQYATVLGGVTGSGVADGEVVIANGAGDQLFHSLCDLALTKHYSVTLNNNLATVLRSTAGISFYDTEFKIVDNTDPTKIAQFECSGITTLTTRTFTLPNASGALATLANTSQTFGGTTVFSPTTTSGTITLGSTTGTGTITVGRSTVNQTIDIGVGATTAVSTKTITIGTNGVSGSTTNVTIGSAVSGALGTTTLNSNVVQSKLLATGAAAPTIASATTIAPTTQILFVSGTTAIATITPPSPISLGGGTITIIPTGAFTTTTAGNIALASTAVVSRALTMTYDVTTTKWYPSY